MVKTSGVLQRLGFDDWKAVVVILGAVGFVALFLGVLPFELHRQAESDFRGTTIQTSPGIVSLVTISPVSMGGGGLFNAIAVKFAGHQEYYPLPQHSLWKPAFGDPVRVVYQIGRKTGQVKIDSVLPLLPASSDHK